MKAVAGHKSQGERYKTHMMLRMIGRAAVVALAVLAVPGAALADDPAESAQAPSQGPMVIERVHNGFAIAPDFRVTTIDGSSARLAGAYGGWVMDNTLLIGAGGYWLTNRPNAFDMAYGGAVVEWLQRSDHTLGFGARGLVGFGRATISSPLSTVTYQVDRDGRMIFLDLHQPSGRMRPGDLRTIGPGNVRAVFREDFFVAEPQANLLINFSRRLRLNTGVGYRLIGSAGGLESRLRGATGSVALEIGGSSVTRQ